MFSLIIRLFKVKNEYDKIESVLIDVKIKGYGVVVFFLEEFSLEELEIMK